MEFEREHDLPYSPEQIWAVLGDFENHRIWNPYVRIEQLAEDPIAIRYSMRMDPHKPKFLEVSAAVLSARPGEELILDVKPSFILQFEESYILTPTATVSGTSRVSARASTISRASGSWDFLITLMARSSPSTLCRPTYTVLKPPDRKSVV